MIFLSIALYVNHSAFGHRYDKNPNLKYFTADELGLEADGVEIQLRKDIDLRGCLYRDSAVETGDVVAFCHGLGPGHAAYMKEIAYLCRQGFEVLAIDNEGCGMSDGKKTKGHYSGIESAEAAVDWLTFNRPGRKLFIVGHSMGGYAALCVAVERKVTGVVAMSAPSTPLVVLNVAETRGMSKTLGKILKPFMVVANRIQIGRKGNLTCEKHADRIEAPVYIIQGDLDSTVPLEWSAYNTMNGDNVTKRLEVGKRHNPYNTVEGEEALAELGKLSRAHDKEALAAFDYDKATEEDEDVMASVANFLKSLQ